MTLLCEAMITDSLACGRPAQTVVWSDMVLNVCVGHDPTTPYVEKPDLRDVVKTVREIARENPDRIYRARTMCSYVTSDDNPGEGCLVGQALMWLGVPREFLACLEDSDPDHTGIHHLLMSDCFTDYLRYDLDDPTDNTYTSWLKDVQSFQDIGYKWNQAVELADRKKAEA